MMRPTFADLHYSRGTGLLGRATRDSSLLIHPLSTPPELDDEPSVQQPRARMSRPNCANLQDERFVEGQCVGHEMSGMWAPHSSAEVEVLKAATVQWIAAGQDPLLPDDPLRPVVRGSRVVSEHSLF